MKAHQRQNGTWEVKGRDPDTNQRKSFYGATEAECLAKAYAAIPRQEDSFDWFVRAVYLPTVQVRAKNYQDQIAWAIDNYLSPAVGNLPLTAIDRKRMQKAFNSFHKSSGTLRIIRAIAHSIFDLAVSDLVIERNPVEGVRIPKDQPKKPQTLGMLDLWTLYQNAGDLQPFVLLTGFAGLRQCEALGVTFSAIKGDVLAVTQQVEKDGRGISQTLKTPQSAREIPIPFVRELGAKRIFVCDGGSGGKYQTPNQTYHNLKVLAESLGLGHVTPHSLRHSFITIMEDDLEAPRRIVQAIVGHAGTQITDGYSRVGMEAKRRWMQAFWEQVSTCHTTLACRKIAQKEPG